MRRVQDQVHSQEDRQPAPERDRKAERVSGHRRDHGRHDQRPEKPLLQQAKIDAVHDRLHQGQFQQQGRQIDHQPPRSFSGQPQHVQADHAKAVYVQQPQQEQPHVHERQQAERVEGRLLGMRRDDVLHPFLNQKSAAKRQDDILRQESPQRRAECQRAEPLRQREIDFAAMVNAVHVLGQLPVRLQQLVSQDQLPDAGHVGHLEIIARQCIAQISHRQKSSLDDAVQQFVDQLLARHLLGQVLRT